MPQDFGADRLLEARARRPEYDSGEKALLREDRAATPESYFGLGQTSAGIWPEFGWQTLSSDSGAVLASIAAPMAVVATRHQ